MFPGATTFVRKSVSNVKPALMVRSPVAVLRGVSPGVVRSRVGGASHKQNSRDSKHDFPAHDQLLCSVAILVCSTYATELTFRVRQITLRSLAASKTICRAQLLVRMHSFDEHSELID